VSRRGVVLFSNLPRCLDEDAGRGPIPCSWNFDALDGFGGGDAFYVTGSRRDQKVHYVWAEDPTVGAWRWLTRRERVQTDRGRRCVIKVAATTRVRCPNSDRNLTS
jgi:hypothetical protein